MGVIWTIVLGFFIGLIAKFVHPDRCLPSPFPAGEKGVVLADKGIHEKIGQERLNQFATLVSQGIRDGRPCEGLCEAIRKIGELLSEHFPMVPGGTNELSDDVITEEGSRWNPATVGSNMEALSRR